MKVLIDGMHAGYRTLVFDYFTNSKGIKTGLYYGYFLLLKNLYNRFKSNIEVAWDEKSFRYNLYPEYKGVRRECPFKDQLPKLKELLSFFGIKQYSGTLMEADDVIACLIKKYSNDQIIIVSFDKDFYQLISDRVFLYNLKTKLLVVEKDVLNEYGVLPKELIMYKTLAGCSSDKIKGVPYLKKDIIKKIAIKFINPNDLFNTISFDLLDKNSKSKLLENKEIVYRNWNLVNLKSEGELKEILVNPNIGKIKNMFEEFEFKKFLENFSEWEELFNKIQEVRENK